MIFKLCQEGLTSCPKIGRIRAFGGDWVKHWKGLYAPYQHRMSLNCETSLNCDQLREVTEFTSWGAGIFVCGGENLDVAPCRMRKI